MTISIPDTLTTDNSEKYIVSIRLRSGGLSFSGYDLESVTVTKNLGAKITR